jgi:hypothetical protein
MLSLAVPSNIGEPTTVPRFESRARQAVVFGSARRKRFALYDDAAQVIKLLQGLSISEIVNIGDSTPIARRQFQRASIAVKETGYIRADLVSDILSVSRVGFVDYPVERIGKSGIFAAYAAHGVVPVIRQSSIKSADGVTIGRETLTLQSGDLYEIESGKFASISSAVREWYEKNSIDCHAHLFLKSIDDLVRETRVQANAAANYP